MSQALDDHASRTQTLVRTTLLLAVAVLMLYPLLWLVGASFKSNAQIFSEVGFWPERFALRHAVDAMIVLDRTTPITPVSAP